MALILALLSICHITHGTNWFIGAPISLQWSATDIKSTQIDISLQYEMNSKPINWIIKTNIENSGSCDLTTTDFNLLSIASQLNISQNTTGQFIVSHLKQSTNASKTLFILQTILFSNSTIGSALTPSNAINTFNLMIANSSCDLTKYKLYASLIQLDSTTLHWNAINNLDITHSDISMGSLYCTISNITSKLKSVSITYGGPWYLQIGLSDIETSTLTSYYAINYNNSNLNDKLYQFIVYNTNNISFKLNKYTNIKKYENIPLTVSNGLNDINIYISLYNQTTKQRWFLNCGQQTTASYFTSFGWQFLNGQNDNISNGNYLFDMYWAGTNNKSKLETFKMSSATLQKAVIINSSFSNIIPGFIFTNDKDFKFHPGDIAEFTIINSSFEMPINLSIYFWQCIGNNCNIIGPEFKVLYNTTNQIIKINLSDGYESLQTNAFINDLKTYINVTIDLCVHTNVSVLIQPIEIIPFYRNYILGNGIGNITWNNNSFKTETKKLKVLLFYSNKFNKIFNSIPLGIVENNGSFNSLMPNFTANATHLLIENNCTGFIQLQSIDSTIQLLNLSSVMYTLFQPLIISKYINGSTISFDGTSTSAHSLSIYGLIEQTIYNANGYDWNIYLTNITNITSLTLDTTNEYALKISNINVSNICSNKIYNSITYCSYNITFENTFAKTISNPPLGTYILSINYCKKKAIETPYISNYYSINNFNNSMYFYSPFLLYSSENIEVQFGSTHNGIVSLISYKSSSMSIDINSQPFIKSVYMVLENTNNSNKFILECDAHLYTYYNSFGWIFKPNIISNGSYKLNVYWNTSTTEFTPQYKLETFNSSQLIIDLTMLNNNSAKYIDIIRVNAKDNSRLRFVKGNTYNFYFTASLNKGSQVEIYFQQCQNESGILKQCKNFYSQNNKPQTFIFNENDQMELIKVPNNNNFKDDEYNSYKLATFIVMDIPLCTQTNVITTKQDISIISNNKSEKLKTGAVIGLVCSAILVLALIGWWLFMRNSSGDGYRTLNE